MLDCQQILLLLVRLLLRAAVADATAAVADITTTTPIPLFLPPTSSLTLRAS